VWPRQASTRVAPPRGELEGVRISHDCCATQSKRLAPPPKSQLQGGGESRQRAGLGLGFGCWELTAAFSSSCYTPADSGPRGGGCSVSARATRAVYEQSRHAAAEKMTRVTTATRKPASIPVSQIKGVRPGATCHSGLPVSHRRVSDHTSPTPGGRLRRADDPTDVLPIDP
jgi:hypothetical protein